MSEEVLLCCPFCGGVAQVTPDVIGSGGQHVRPYHVGCFMPACGIVFTDEEPEAAIAAWNRRAPDPALSVLREAREWLNDIYRSDDDWSPKGREQAGNLCERIDAILSGAPDHDPKVAALVEAAILLRNPDNFSTLLEGFKASTELYAAGRLDDALKYVARRALTGETA